ncbi:probable RNA-binding protein 18 [Topomyia yanbarensis]|uniref:probable RNA-binding protein 18 n=1 Tax=Topomyia yanbarensis TaxID=2498891 RepID=UPI00273B6CBD|nr:probable RNA-binding protein 18 [Topomyia yanbarensis]XP_058828924.1 probable RNA-binding protein 18 [Topomyia yanbarensis]
MLFHRSGPMAGYPRGYAFVTYEKQKDSEGALEILNGKLVGDKHMVVRWAKNVNRDEMERTKPKLQIPALAGGSKAGPSGPVSQQTKIQALEAKLKMMESRSDDLIINKSINGEKAIIEKYQYNKNPPQQQQQHRLDSSKSKRHISRGGRNGPYKSSRFK